jgi:hypothetical protein
MLGLPGFAVHASAKKTVRRAFTPEEDAVLVEIITKDPSMRWTEVAKHLPSRTARQCRERWAKYLTPQIRVAEWTEEEDLFLLRQIELHGHRWTAIAQAFVNRSDNDVKNRWYTHLRDSLAQCPDGRFELRRDAEGNRIHARPKRRREHVAAGRVAFQAFERKVLQAFDQKSDPDTSRVILPQLCSPDLRRLLIPELFME